MRRISLSEWVKWMQKTIENWIFLFRKIDNVFDQIYFLYAIVYLCIMRRIHKEKLLEFILMMFLLLWTETRLKFALIVSPNYYLFISLTFFDLLKNEAQPKCVYACWISIIISIFSDIRNSIENKNKTDFYFCHIRFNQTHWQNMIPNYYEALNIDIFEAFRLLYTFRICVMCLIS